MKRLNLDDPKVFNTWRALYNDLTHEENIQFGNDIEERYPTQTSFNFGAVSSVLEEMNKPSVFEIGGWKGELAYKCFKQELVSKWHNVDMCKAAVDKTLPELSTLPYTAKFPDSFDWFTKDFVKPTADIVISCHTIEHLSDEHLKQLITYLSIYPMILIEAPIEEGQSDWAGYQGTHILKMGWADIDKEFLKFNFKSKRLTDWVRLYEQ